MRLTVLGQLTKSVRSSEDWALVAELETTLERLKWSLWYGNLFRALQGDAAGSAGGRSSSLAPGLSWSPGAPAPEPVVYGTTHPRDGDQA